MENIFENFTCEYRKKTQDFIELLCSTTKIIEKCGFPKNYEDTSYKNTSDSKVKVSCFDVKVSDGKNAVSGRLNDLKNKHKYVYIIFWTNDKLASCIQSDMEKKKALQKRKNDKYSLPLNNYINASEEERRLFEKNKVLYVGSSKNIQSRLGQHFFGDSKTVYALHLNTWFADASCKVFAFDFTDALDSEYTDYQLLLIEDTVASIYKPLFGKRGPNTK